jgi:hypothetical protein
MARKKILNITELYLKSCQSPLVIWQSKMQFSLRSHSGVSVTDNWFVNVKLQIDAVISILRQDKNISIELKKGSKNCKD